MDRQPPIPIAIIGIGCRFSGEATSPSKYWQLLSSRKSTWSPIPSSRWNSSAFYDANPDQQGSHNTRGGHFVAQDVAAFDAGFWGIPPAECEAMDPQHRMQLEMAYEALENAGITREEVQGSDTAVYVATFSEDYKAILAKDINDVPRYHTIGIGTSIISNRISYQLDLRGPSVTLDTGCSGSLVAVHQACQSLKLGECRMALAGGVNLVLNPDQTVTMSLMRCFTEEGRCYSFDDRGSGYGRGEGGAMVALKRLDDAIRDGDPIRAVIRNTGINQDGKTNGIMVPNSDAQRDLIRAVYEDARLDPNDTPVVEAHGTGTAVGDPLEVSAIQQALRRPGGANAPLFIGSVKPNVGHLEAASGIAGLIKGVLMLEHDKVAATINIESLKPNLRLDEFNMVIPREQEDWPEGTVRRLSLSNYGYGGTNAHLILEAASEFMPGRRKTIKGLSNGVNGFSNGVNDLAQTSQNPLLIALTAESTESLSKVVQDVESWASAQSVSEELFEDLAFTLVSRRAPMRHRIAFPARSIEDVVSKLQGFKPPRDPSYLQPRLLFVFTGQGAQWYAMGRELMGIQSPFQTSLLKSDSLLRIIGADWSLIEELAKDSEASRINESELAQSATCAIQIALVDLLADIGIKPHTVVGHSSGEIAAAYAAGAVDQASALTIAWNRGTCTRGDEVRRGAMLAVALGEEQAATYLSKVKSGRAVIACANSPASTTISGDSDAIDEVDAAIKSDFIFARRLLVDRAYHSHHMQEAAEQYLARIKHLKLQAPAQEVRFVSSVTGKPKTTPFTPQYWTENLVSKVRFADAVRQALHMQASTESKSSPHLIVEIGPHNALAGPIRQILASLSPEVKAHQFSSLTRSTDSIDTFTNLAADLFVQGCSVKLNHINAISRPHEHPKVLSSLPPYAWNHSNRYWHESRISKEHRFRQYPYHDLLGIQIPGRSSPRPTWRHILNLKRLPWLQEHVVNGEIIFSAAGYIAMALEALRQIAEDPERPKKVLKYELKDLRFITPLVIPESGASVEIQLQLLPIEGSHWDDFVVYGTEETGTVIEYCRGYAMATLEYEADEVEGAREASLTHDDYLQNLNRTKALPLTPIDTNNFYRVMRTKGNSYGPHFACMKKIATHRDQALSMFQVPNIVESMPGGTMQSHLVHPAVIDGFLHPSIALADPDYTSGSVVTASIQSLVVFPGIQNSVGTQLDSCTKLTDQWSQACMADIDVFQTDTAGHAQPAMHIHGLRLQEIGVTNAPGTATQRSIIYSQKWGVDVDHVTAQDINPYKEETNVVSTEQAAKLLALNKITTFFIDCAVKALEGNTQLIVHSRHERLVDWMRRFCTSSEFHDLISLIPRNFSVEDILNETRTLGVEGEVLARIGANIVGIVTGEVEPLSLFTEEGLLWRLYADDASVRCYGYAIEYLRNLVFKNPNMAVLEIGAGTGGATEPILQALGEDSFPFASYDFTDVSASFFERSRERLRKWDRNMRYRKLDLQEDPVSQGFEKGTFDLILASNVLHVAHSIDEALSRIRKLLRPGGRILMIETTVTVPFLNFSIGVLPGWWAAQDGRINGPLISEEGWNTMLERNGLEGISLVGKDFEGPAHRCSMIVSKPISLSEPQDGRYAPVEVILPPSWEIAQPALVQDLVSSVRKTGRHVVTASLRNVKPSPGKIYVILDNGAAPMLGGHDSILFKSIIQLVTSPVSLLWVSVQENISSANNPKKSLIAGFLRTARTENRSLRAFTLNVQDVVSEQHTRNSFASTVSKFLHAMRLSDQAQPTVEFDSVLRGGQVYIERVLPDKHFNHGVAKSLGTAAAERQSFHQEDRPLKLSLENARIIDKIKFEVDESIQGALSPQHLEVRVEALGINFKDVLIAGGHTKKKLNMAGEFSGIVIGVGSEFQGAYDLGDRVCGFGATPYASRIRVRGESIAKVPSNLSMTAAATIPVVFATAYHSLVDVARLEKGQTVLIHSAAGGVGQAAITIAHWIGAEVFATVSNASKKNFLTKEFGIPESHIFSSKLRTFKEGISRQTNDEGVDVVLNSLSGQHLQDSLACVSRFGTFVEIGKTDIHMGSRLSMAPFDSNITLASVDLSLAQEHRPAKTGQLIQKAVSLISEGKLRLPSFVVRPLEELGPAFMSLQNRTHMGKIVLDAGENAMVEAPPIKTKICVSEHGTYVIAGGRSGLGFELGKNLVRQGARHIVLLSRRAVSREEEENVAHAFQGMNASVKLLSCDITDESNLSENLLKCLEDMPPVRGFIQSTMVAHYRMLHAMEVDDFQVGIGAKVDGTQNLLKVLGNHSLDFCLMMSSLIGGTSGTTGQGNYAAANAYLAGLASSQSSNQTRFIAICPGIVQDAGVLVDDESAVKLLQRQGFLKMQRKDVVALVDYALSEEGIRKKANLLTSGFDYQSWVESGRQDALENPLFSHLPRHDTRNETSSSEKAIGNIHDLLANASSKNEAETLIAEAIAKKVQTLVANEKDIDTSSRLGHLGIDSLTLVELKNWFVQTFHVRLQTNDIYDALSIVHLATVVVTRSSKVTSKASAEAEPGNVTTHTLSNGTNHSSLANGADHESDLPKQPLPDLDSTLDLWLTAVSPVLPASEYTKATRLVEEFRAADGPGRKLQARLTKLANDPSIDNWQEQLYNRFQYLRPREPLVPRLNFAGTHSNTNSRSAAEIAAVVAHACHDFCRQLEEGTVEHQIERGQKLERNQYHKFFNTTREPRIDEDVVVKYPGNEYLVAFRRGRAFKIDLDASLGVLKSHFQNIIESPHEPESWVGVLTTDERNSWARNREVLRDTSKANAQWLHTIEAAEFVVYLDESKPVTGRDRAHQFLLNGFNRWSDKTVQLAVCDNGWSATIGEHSMIDGYAMRRLNNLVQEAIDNHTATVPLQEVRPLSSHIFQTSPELQDEILKARGGLKKRASLHDFVGFDVQTLNFDFFRNYKVSPISGMQMVIQLASKEYFGFNPIGHESVGLAHFRKGRVELNHILWPEVKRFCDAALSSSSDANKGELRRLFFDAVKVHTNNVMRSSQGYGVDRHLLSLEWSVIEGENVPELFASDAYKGSRPALLVTDCLKAGVVEAFSLPAHPDGLWVHFESEGDKVVFSCWGKPERIELFEVYIQECAKVVREILEGGSR
ncbi:hypothetical protein DM02DRAFT_684379 [Periconia macrospinosa]|uniref:Uncharacterized protein n=1 Tax=Periconia macrospinosa TaxID=97972 RepID=A0A2V1DHU7_9PLEO|nr:hypothetical protein DM02DRAFT_684379 [Periconia macrospinosa]